MFNCLETIAILVYKQISSDSFKNEITYKLFTYKSHVYPFKYVQTMTDFKLLVLYCNTWNHAKKWLNSK